MTTSMNDGNEQNNSFQEGAFADGLTLVRVVLTPIIMFVIIKAWSAKPDDPMGFISLDLKLVLLASTLFIIAALTDIADDFVGGSANASGRLLGWFDDIADSVLIAGTLLALLWVSYQSGLLHWTFAVPAIALITRDIILTFAKSYEISKFGLQETRLGDLKSAIAMFATCILVASPWLSNIVDSIRAGNTAEGALRVYNNSSHLVWNTGLVLLWLSAILSILTAIQILKAANQENIEASK